MLEDIKKKIRTPTKQELNTLPYMSYSKLDTFINCPYSYKLKYEDKMFSHVSSLAMQIGSILHYGLELKALSKMNGASIDYESIKQIILSGTQADKTSEKIIGINDLKKKYFEDWYQTDDASNMNYEEKLQTFMNKTLPTRMEDEEWKIVGAEVPFTFVYDNRVIFHGFIDRIDVNIHDANIIRIVDYKTSKKTFSDSKIKTPLQHIVYDLACAHNYGIIPQEHEYDFILLDKKQTSADGLCSKGYLKRGITKIDKVLDEIQHLSETAEYNPKPSPLCYWCAYHSDSPFSDPQYKGVCEYHSLWTPENKTFETLNSLNKQDNLKQTDKSSTTVKRKLIF